MRNDEDARMASATACVVSASVLIRSHDEVTDAILAVFITARRRHISIASVSSHKNFGLFYAYRYNLRLGLILHGYCLISLA